MVRAGEASGQLSEILARLADYLEATQRLKREIKSAMTYPVISLVMVFGIAAFLMIGIVPKFKEIFDGLGVPLPGVTKAVMGASLFMRDNVLVCFGGLAAIVFALITFKKSPPGRRFFDRFVLRVPVFGPLFRKVALSRFSRTFSTLIKSGVPIIGALEIVGETSGNTVIENAVKNAAESVKCGDTLSGPLGKEPVFPPMVVRMIGIGERAGALEQLLEKISEFYDQQVEAEVKGLTSMIEPLLIAVMGIVVGGIVLAVFLPIMKLQEALTPK
jgi:type IV pilus assembly protein PilC